MKRNKLNSRIGKVAIVGTAFLVFWIYLGSLINFHQHHIFGRTLIPAGIVSKREESLHISNSLPSFDSFLSPVIPAGQAEIMLQLQFSDIIFPNYCPLQFIISGIPGNHGLRAPPHTA
ncbi:MAG: hypothetical protein RBS07_15615 [Lentimicrobium sp.]|jgi:hypothetical protein|nr:hypothetical protein [Lentimicrobium sp.]